MRRIVAALVLACLALPAWAQSSPAGFPDRPIRIVVPFSPGGATDVGARLLAEALGAVSPQPVLVENRFGGAGMVGAEAVARAAPDGHTLLFNNTSQAVLRVVVPSASFDPHQALTPVSMVTEMPMVMLVANNFPAADAREFISLVRANPGKYDYGSSGGGGTLGMAALLFLTTTGLDMSEIPYRGGAPATLDLAAGRIALVYDIALTGLQTARGGQARAFAVSGPRRSPAAPEVPTWREVGVDAEMVVWQAVFAPAATPLPVREALRGMLAKVQENPAMQRRWAELGVDRVTALPVAESEQRFTAEVERWERLMANYRAPQAAPR